VPVYLIEVIYDRDALLQSDCEVEECLSEVVNCIRLNEEEEGFRDGINGGDECFDIFILRTQTLFPYIEQALWDLKKKGIVREWHVYETDWMAIKNGAEKIY